MRRESKGSHEKQRSNIRMAIVVDEYGGTLARKHTRPIAPGSCVAGNPLQLPNSVFDLLQPSLGCLSVERTLSVPLVDYLLQPNSCIDPVAI